MICSTRSDFVTSCETKVLTTVPSRITVTRSVRLSTSSKSCETNSTLAPWALIRLAKVNNRSTSVPAKNGVGSSRTSKPLFSFVASGPFKSFGQDLAKTEFAFPH